MDVTEIRIKLMEDSDDRLQAFCSITFDDCFVVRDLKIIEGSNGPFVAMPSRKLTARCRSCGCRNYLRAQFCNQCGKPLSSRASDDEDDGHSKLYADIAHPINTDCREMIQQLVIDEYEREVDMADEPGYANRYDDDYALNARNEVDDEPVDEPQLEDPAQDDDDQQPQPVAESVAAEVVAVEDDRPTEDDACQEEADEESSAEAFGDDEGSGFGDDIFN